MENYNNQVIKGYTLKERIGAGGFGVVYRAHQASVGRDVAIKVILPERSNQAEFIRRFEVEAQLIARLEHPHIVPLYDYWRDPDGAFLVMRWLPTNLRAALQQNPWSVDNTARLLEHIAGALSIAHRDNIIHRDIKPDNILLDEDQNAYLSDFGIAKDLSLRHNNQTEEGTWLGSPDYFTPEQIKGETVTPRTDIYSLGLVIYEMLCGEKPFAEATTPAELINKHLFSPLPPLSAHRPNLPVALNEVLQTATAKDPDQRYSNVLRFAAAFRAAAPLLRRTTPQPLAEPLTDRELLVLKLIIEGLSNKEIAAALHLSGSTVKWYVNQIFSKLDVRNRHQAIERTHQLGLLPGQRQPPPLQVVGDEQITIKGDSDAALHTHIISSRIPELANPYKGLRAFQETDADLFFGRAALTEQLLSRLSDKNEGGRFLAVVGPSGSGKSSIVKAGLIPAIRRGALPDSTQWFITEMQPGTHPLEELEAALLRVAVNPLPGLLSNLSEDRRGLVRAVKRVLPTEQTVELVLVIDQFEELFTLTTDEEVRQHFIDNLLSAVSDTRGRIRVILTLRADFYDKPLSYPRLAELARSHSEFVIPLTPDELERAIAGPAEHIGLSLEPRLVATIINDVVRGPGTLPLLQFALTELFEKRRGHTLTLEAYRETGGIRGALTHRADQLYNELPEAEQAVVRQLFLRLITLGEGTEDTRRRVLQTELETLPDYRVLEDVVDIFSHHRLLTFDHDPLTRSSTVEIAHEALIREWGNMRDWLTTSRELLRLHHRVMESAAEWLRNGRESAFLSVGTRLSQFETLMHESDIVLNAVELEYLQASIAAHDKQIQAEKEQRQRELELAQQAADSANKAANNALQAAAAQKQAANRLYYLAGALGIFLMIATILAIVTFNQSQVAQASAAEAQNVALVAGSRAALERYDTEMALALAWQAVALNPSSDLAQTALSQSAYAPGTVRKYVGHTAPVWRVAFSPDDQTFLSGGADGTLILWNTTTGAVIHRIKDDLIPGYIKAAFSPDGHTAIYGGDNGMLGVLDTATGEVIRRFKGHNGWIATVGFSSDGQPYSCGQDGVLVVWDMETDTAVHRFTGPTDVMTDCVFSSDDSMAVAGFQNGTLMIWDVSSGDLLHRFETGQRVQSVDLSSDGLYVLAGMIDSGIYLWDLQTQQIIRRFIGHTAPINDARFSLDGKQVVSAAGDDIVGVWNVETGQLIRELRGGRTIAYTVIFSSDGRYVLAGGADNTIRLWDLWEGQIVRKFVGHHDWIQSIALSPDQKTALTASWDGTAIVWNVETGQELRRLTAPQGAVLYDVAYAPDGATALIAGGVHYGGPGDVILWDLNTGQILRRYSGHTAFSSAVAFSHDGTTFMSGSGNGSAFLWDTHSGEIIRRFGENQLTVTDIVFSPDGKTVIITSFDGNIILWNVETAQMIRRFIGHSGIVTSIDFTNDGQQMVSRGIDGSILWDVATGGEIQRFFDPNGQVGGAILSPDNRTVFGASGPDNAGLWDKETGRIIRFFSGHGPRVTAQTFLSDGRSVMVGFVNGDVELWNIDSLDELLDWTQSHRYIPDVPCQQRELYHLTICDAER